ncbi:hypothetical protein PSHT_01195 [Puccinia striiformis]|uniref:Ras-GEF domain-containing protein n=2 Tax=Puccinia striiformis TaxID=27350 RepID=A0A2S4W2S1_9BASI|nr:hypothetical protein PSTT_01684 [Puccinia striiformis]POW22473.1 hypothetical protein PSHT_01195 [Puccinia striiformis]
MLILNLSFFIWEVEEYTALRDQWIREGKGFVLGYLIKARSTFERIKQFRSQILQVKDTESMPIILLGKKADKVNEREVGKDKGLACAQMSVLCSINPSG